MTDWPALLGCEPAEYCGRIYHARPAWISGYISHHDARFVFGRALDSGVARVVEIGTASGLSAAILCHALHAAHLAGRIGDDWSVETFDIDPLFYADRDYATGDAAREMLSPELLEHLVVRAPATAADVGRHHDENTVGFAFIDASHQHPWPSIDLLTLLPSLRPGAEVLLHDINLPLLHSDHADWGAKHLYDGLDVVKEADGLSDPPNVGMIRVPEDKAALRAQILGIVEAHAWETEIDEDALQAAGVARPA